MRWFKKSHNDELSREYEDYRILTVYVRDKTYKINVVDPWYYNLTEVYSFPLNTSVIDVYKLSGTEWTFEYRSTIKWSKYTNTDTAESLSKMICESVNAYENEGIRRSKIDLLDGQSIDCECESTK